MTGFILGVVACVVALFAWRVFEYCWHTRDQLPMHLLTMHKSTDNYRFKGDDS